MEHSFSPSVYLAKPTRFSGHSIDAAQWGFVGLAGNLTAKRSIEERAFVETHEHGEQKENDSKRERLKKLLACKSLRLLGCLELNVPALNLRSLHPFLRRSAKNCH